MEGKTMRSLHQQKGVTAIGWLIILGLIVLLWCC